MTLLKRAIARVLRAQSEDRHAFSVQLPRTSALSRAQIPETSNVQRRLEKYSEPLATYQARLTQQAAEAKLSEVLRSDLRRVHEAIWDGPAPIAADPEIFEPLLGEVSRRGSRPAVRNLIGSYLIGYRTKRVGIDVYSRWLDLEVQKFDWAWAHRARTFGLFKRDSGPVTVALAVLNDDTPVPDRLAVSGLEPPRDMGGFAEAAFIEACRIVKGQTAPGVVASQERLMAWASAVGTSDKLQLRFSQHWEDLAAALFLPWANVEPPPRYKNRLIDFALKTAGDPRVSPRLWHGSRSEAQSVLRRWLNKISFKHFFEFVDQTALGRQWDYRRAFWSAWLDAGHVTDAWVAFGTQAARLARRKGQQAHEDSLLQFGITSGGGRTPQQSALLLQIGNLTISDWSHNGRYNLWRTRDTRAPKLYRSLYDGYDLQSESWYGSHTSAYRFGWQKTVAGIIREETGLKTDSAQWQPK
jgi:hypothetical protein